MPVLQTMLGELNVHMSRDKIQDFARNRDLFAPGKDTDYSFLMADHPEAVDVWHRHLGRMPMGIRTGLRAIIHHALSTEPPTQVTFAWAPGYDYEMTVWQAPDTRSTKGGITVLLKSRYPSDQHPLDATGDRAEAS